MNNFKVSEEIYPYAALSKDGRGRFWASFQWENEKEVKCFKLCKNKKHAQKVVNALNAAVKIKA
ncbi:MAG TPA: hypothetical protein VMW42_02095 [Desulfatiglandales bacterium]|nr:hypothetical protein [Desulfatiglandales bacterium]